MKYVDYVVDEHFLARYNAYQERYASTIPERDKVTIKLLDDISTGTHMKVLDIGCSTGNLLLHIKRLLPNLELFGADLADSSIEAARKNPDLAGVKIGKMDMLAIEGSYDIIISNAVTYLFDDELFVKAATSVRKAARTWIDFDWFSPFTDQRVTINEVTPSHPNGIDIHIRPYNTVTRMLKDVGFKHIEFRPFAIPIDLPRTGFDGDPITYTRQSEGGRLQFRGVLYQPWHHLIAS